LYKLSFQQLGYWCVCESKSLYNFYFLNNNQNRLKLDFCFRLLPRLLLQRRVPEERLAGAQGRLQENSQRLQEGQA
jgi:hypothetical protein